MLFNLRGDIVILCKKGLTCTLRLIWMFSIEKSFSLFMKVKISKRFEAIVYMVSNSLPGE